MPEKNTNAYTVCVLLGPELNSVLLVRKNRTAFKGMLNGPGGAVEPGETPYEGALREIYEETGLSPIDLMPLDTARLAKLGELWVPEDCKTNDGSGCLLHYYAGAVRPESLDKIRPAEEKLAWRPRAEVEDSGTDSAEFAGHGDLAYFTAAGYRALSARLPVQTAPAKGPGHAMAKSLAESIAVARGRLDADFRNRDLYRASQDAAEVSRLAYAAFYMDAAKRDYKRKGDRKDGGKPETDTDGRDS